MKEKRKSVKTILIITIALMLIVSLFAFVGCTDYGYIFYFSVEEGEGELTMPLDSAPTIHECKDQENMYEVYLRGGKKGYRELTFIAIPAEGYQVKEWVFNGEVVEGNKTDTFVARVTSDMGYSGVIAVRFEKIQNQTQSGQ